MDPVRPAQRQARARRAGLSPKSFLDRHFLIAASWPSLIIMLMVTAIPFALTMALSLTDYDLVRSSDWHWIGIDNFTALAVDDKTAQVIFNTAYLVIATTLLETVFGLILAVLMESRFRGIGLIRSLYLVPIMIAPVVVALTSRAMFNNDSGWINYFLGLLHLPQPLWLGDPALAMPAVIISDMWTGIPFMAVLLLAALLGVSSELKEAAAVDGANPFQVFTHVTLPVILPVVFIAAMLKFMEGFRKFEGIQLLTTGGPGLASTTLTLHIYNTGLFYYQTGYAAAYGVVMVAMIAASLGLFYLVLRRVS